MIALECAVVALAPGNVLCANELKDVEEQAH
jgi:hypothetical protein